MEMPYNLCPTLSGVSTILLKIRKLGTAFPITPTIGTVLVKLHQGKILLSIF